MKKFLNKKVLALAFLTAVIFLSFAPLHFTHAATSSAANDQGPEQTSFLTCAITSGDLVSCAIATIGYYVKVVMGYLVLFGDSLIGFTLTLNGTLLTSPVVQLGFSVALSLANLGFVLGIIVIALATILRSETYGIKQTLWKLVIMAILVNFGLVIAGPIVGLADNLTGYFVNAAGTGSGQTTGSAQGFANNLTAEFAPQQIANPLQGTPSNLQGQESQYSIFSCKGLLNNVLYTSCLLGTITSGITGGDNNQDSATKYIIQVVGIIFQIIFLGLTAFALLAIAILLVIRYLYLTFLLVLLPLAWLMWIFPKLDHHFSEWWGLFLRWTFFPVLSVFFIYLAMTIAPGTLGTSQNVNYIARVLGAQNVSNPFVALGETVVNQLVLCGLVIGGLVAANSLGIKGADTALGGAKWVGGQVKGFAGRKATNARRNVTDRIRSAGRQYDPQTKETTTALQRFGSRFQKIPVLRQAGTALANKSAPAAFHEERADDIKHYADENLKSLTNEGLKKRAVSNNFINPTRTAAIAQEIAHRNLTTDSEISPLMDKYVETAERMGTLETITSNRPDLMPPRDTKDSVTGAIRRETQAEATARAIQSAKSDVVQANPSIFNLTNPGAASAKLGAHVTTDVLKGAVLVLSPAQLGALGSDTTSGSQERQNNLTDAVRSLVAGLKVMNASGKFELDTAALAAAAIANPQMKNLEKIVKHMENSPNWGSVLN